MAQKFTDHQTRIDITNDVQLNSSSCNNTVSATLVLSEMPNTSDGVISSDNFLPNHTCVNITEHLNGDNDNFQSGNYTDEEVRDASDKNGEVKRINDTNFFRRQQSVSVDSHQELNEPIDRRRSRRPYTITTIGGNCVIKRPY